MSARRILSLSYLGLAFVAGVALGLKRHEAAGLRGEIALLCEEHQELARLRMENQRLVTALPPAATLNVWRADHAAVQRLRAEIETLKDNVQMRERRLAERARNDRAGLSR